ncbi:MAG: c-type cytochrome [Gammaproteobacteria bacterium]|nr:c-type cytochrome [Gammaproteobacteria bacterium]
MKKLLITATLISSTLITNAAIAQGNAEAGKSKSMTCSACHGADGNSIAPNFPSLAGQGESYLYKQISDFKKANRTDPSMTAMVAPLSDQDMHDLAAFFSAQKLKGGQADPKQVARGKLIYKTGIKETNVPACMGCHGPTGSGNPGSKYPQLSSQNSTYVEKQLTDFRTAAQNPDQDANPMGRHNDPSAMMRNAVKTMNDFDIKAVAQYIQGLQP